jgi:plastocyanin
MLLANFSRRSLAGLFALVLCLSALSHAQDSNVTAQVELVTENKHARKTKANANAVIWLTSLDSPPAVQPASELDPSRRPRLVQKDKRFEPHVLVVPVGTAVEFPNHDPFFHNVFSLFEGKRFDLGLYEAGTTRLVHFDRPGVSYIFCNIHPEMSAAVIALKTPYYAVSDSAGRVSITGVPPGRYSMQVWVEGASVDNLKALSREVTISGRDQSLGMVRVTEDSPPELHKNKYGRDYDAPGSDYPPTEPR